MAVTGDLDRYRYIATLGSGGMASVDLAEDTLLGRRVALKRLHATADESGILRLRREALAGASLSAPNLVAIYDIITGPEGHFVIVMEYVEGETLRQAIDRQGRLPVGEALRILQGVAAGLDAIHAAGIVHRDVKPSNILLGSDGVVKLADLGIASVPDRTQITTAGDVLGSLSYMAPEQLEDSVATPAIDIYALAAVAFEALSGERARSAPNALALAHIMSTQPPPDLRAAWPAAPPRAADVLRQGMAAEPRDRPGSAGELVARLERALEPEHTTRVAGAPPPSGEGERRRAWLIAAGLVALVLVAAAVAVALSSGGTSRKPKQGHAKHRHKATPASHTATHRAPPATASSSSSSSTTPSTTSSSSTSSTPSSSSSSSSSSTTSSSSASAASSSAEPPPGAGAANPVSAVQTFYADAASHDYAGAWALADPALRAQLQGYRAFQADQAGDRAITFHTAKVVNQSSTAATVAIRTTSVRDNGTQQCSGTVQAVPAGTSGGWLLHGVDINCA